MSDTPEQGTEQAVDDGGTTATPAQGDTAGSAAPDAVEDLKKQLEAVQAEAETLKKRHQDATRKIQQQGQDLNRFRQLYQQSDTGQPEYGADTVSQSNATPGDDARALAAWAVVANEIEGSPKEKEALRIKVDQFLQEDPNAWQFVRGHPLHTYKAVIDHWGQESRDKELAELREMKKKLDAQKESLTAGAVVSGSGAGETPTAMSREEFAKLPTAEKREVLKKLGMYKG